MCRRAKGAGSVSQQLEDLMREKMPKRYSKEEIASLEAKDVEGYKKQPLTPEELDDWLSEQPPDIVTLPVRLGWSGRHDVLLSDAERWDFVSDLSGAELFNRILEWVSQLKEFDVIGLNEVFDEVPRDLLFTKLKDSFGDNYHQSLPPPDTNSKFGIGNWKLLGRCQPLPSRRVSLSAIWFGGKAAP
jgi:hypothetical protein